MEYYSAIENEDILTFVGKWMELENIILSEVTHNQKDSHGMSSLIFLVSAVLAACGDMNDMDTKMGSRNSFFTCSPSCSFSYNNSPYNSFSYYN